MEQNYKKESRGCCLVYQQFDKIYSGKQDFF